MAGEKEVTKGLVKVGPPSDETPSAVDEVQLGASKDTIGASKNTV